MCRRDRLDRQIFGSVSFDLHKIIGEIAGNRRCHSGIDIGYRISGNRAMCGVDGSAGRNRLVELDDDL